SRKLSADDADGVRGVSRTALLPGRGAMSGLERATQEHPRLHPIPLHSAMRQSERIRRLLLGKAAEETTLDDLRHARLDRRDAIERVVDLQDDVGLIVHGEVDVLERDLAPSAASLERAA